VTPIERGFVRKIEGKGPFGRHGFKWECNIKSNVML